MLRDGNNLTPFGIMLRAYMKRQHVSLRDFAARAGIASSDISRMANGRTRLTLRILRRASMAAGWTDAEIGHLVAAAEEAESAS